MASLVRGVRVWAQGTASLAPTSFLFSLSQVFSLLQYPIHKSSPRMALPGSCGSLGMEFLGTEVRGDLSFEEGVRTRGCAQISDVI